MFLLPEMKKIKTPCNTHPHALSHPHMHTEVKARAITLSLTYTHTHTHWSLSFKHTHTLSISLSLSYTHTLLLPHTYSYNHSFSHAGNHHHSRVHTLAHTRPLNRKSCIYYSGKIMISESKLGHKNGCTGKHFFTQKSLLPATHFNQSRSFKGAMEKVIIRWISCDWRHAMAMALVARGLHENTSIKLQCPPTAILSDITWSWLGSSAHTF